VGSAAEAGPGTAGRDAPAVHERRLTGLLLALTFGTGVVDAVSFVVLDVFTAIMTGNVIFLGLGLAGHTETPVHRAPLAVLAFVTGAVLVGRLQRGVPPAVRCPRSSGVLLLVAATIVAACCGVHAVAARAEAWTVVLTASLAAAMGLQVAVVRRMAVSDLTTVVVTLTLASWATDSRMGRGARTRADRRLAAVAVMVLGAVVGALLARRGAELALALSSLILLATGVGALLLARSKPRGAVARLAR
jgi:uncharacterized membrane protein YoaK (UPF0700 family)